jgi:hypothetical protein
MRRLVLGAVVAGVALGGFAATSSAKTVWLCKPGQRPDPCTPGLSTTIYSPSFTTIGVAHPRQVAQPTIDCFYVYPTVSDQQTGNANLHVDPEEIAFSTFDQPPPTATFFGTATNPNLQVLCTNPAALGGGSGLLDPIAPSAPFAPGTLIAAGNALLNISFPHPPTVWWTTPGAYRAECETLNGATVLEITVRDGAPVPSPSPTPMWGLHLLDANIALGNLIALVKSEATAFARSGR